MALIVPPIRTATGAKARRGRVLGVIEPLKEDEEVALLAQLGVGGAGAEQGQDNRKDQQVETALE